MGNANRENLAVGNSITALKNSRHTREQHRQSGKTNFSAATHVIEYKARIVTCSREVAGNLVYPRIEAGVAFSISASACRLHRPIPA
jgi:hypothetical protein